MSSRINKDAFVIFAKISIIFYEVTFVDLNKFWNNSILIFPEIKILIVIHDLYLFLKNKGDFHFKGHIFSIFIIVAQSLLYK